MGREACYKKYLKFMLSLVGGVDRLRQCFPNGGHSSEAPGKHLSSRSRDCHSVGLRIFLYFLVRSFDLKSLLTI